VIRHLTLLQYHQRKSCASSRKLVVRLGTQTWTRLVEHVSCSIHQPLRQTSHYEVHYVNTPATTAITCHSTCQRSIHWGLGSIWLPLPPASATMFTTDAGDDSSSRDDPSHAYFTTLRCNAHQPWVPGLTVLDELQPQSQSRIATTAIAIHQVANVPESLASLQQIKADKHPVKRTTGQVLLATSCADECHSECQILAATTELQHAQATAAIVAQSVSIKQAKLSALSDLASSTVHAARQIHSSYEGVLQC
jgi:hypothetical protein